MIPAPIAPLAVSLGDPAGIGPEVVAKCWDHRSAFNLPAFLAVGDARSLSAVWDGPIVTIDDRLLTKTANVRHRTAGGPVGIVPHGQSAAASCPSPSSSKQ